MALKLLKISLENYFATNWKQERIPFNIAKHTALCFLFDLVTGKNFRSIRLGTTKLHTKTQLELFFQENPVIRRLYQSIDYLNNRFGLNTVNHGIAKFEVKGNTYFKERSI